MTEGKDHVSVTALFTKLVHHKKLFVINITQNFFTNSKETRTRRLNAQYVAIFKNPSDATQIHVIGRQMYPGNSQFLIDVYKHVARHAHGYIFLDLRQDTREPYQVRSNILRDEFPMVLYKQADDEM